MLSQLALTLALAATGTIAMPTSTSTSTGVNNEALTATLTILAASTKPSGVLKYQPSSGGNYAFGVVYAIFTVVIFFYVFRKKDWWSLCLPIGTFFSAIGYFIRPSMNPDSVALSTYIAQTAFVVISPVAFLAFNYLLYGRLILAVDQDFGNQTELEGQALTASQRITMIKKAGGPKREKSRFSLIPPRIVARVFIWSDITTFIIQLGAGGLQASGGKGNPRLVQIGGQLFLAGVTLQGISYILFTTLVTYTTLKVFADSNKITPLGTSSRRFLGLSPPIFGLVSGLYFSSLFVIIRSVYRIIEFAQGYDGYLVSHEIYLFVLDAAPLVLAVGIWVVMWPSYLLEKVLDQRFASKETDKDLSLHSLST
ncbi:LOW QUALITY PROTEIN: hypothetical protein BCV70DRAFT_227931 [Testicularia cyperi]|uniref:RTA1-domain-containing protein n=1 Tax=Testicularia cyperi TaxID=1882483 RepID=A0A317XLC8_9BASI|nr:LOW QUALITY PROTEIN: hypothetical protein BCV70DRAFT_227931 [Testicularia cyperi]